SLSLSHASTHQSQPVSAVPRPVPPLCRIVGPGGDQNPNRNRRSISRTVTGSHIPGPTVNPGHAPRWIGRERRRPVRATDSRLLLDSSDLTSKPTANQLPFSPPGDHGNFAILHVALTLQ